MAQMNLDTPELFINRELSWLEFNDRVLRLGMADDVPLLERLKFLAIVSSNLDEFFMIRVAGLKQQRAADVRKPDVSGLTPKVQLEAISERVRRMVDEQSKAIRDLTALLANEGIHLLEPGELSPVQREFVASTFAPEILPVLTPLAADDLVPTPILPGQRLYLALLLAAGPPDGAKDREVTARGAKRSGANEPEAKAVEPSASETGAPAAKLAVLPVPADMARFMTLPADRGLHLIRLEEVIAASVSAVFPGHAVRARAVFRLTRDADVAIDEEDAAELLAAVEKAVTARMRRTVVRLEISAGADRQLRKQLADLLEVKSEDVYEIDGMLDATALMEIAGHPGFEHLKYPDWPPQPARDLAGANDLWQALQTRDVLLFHPYESFDPVVRLVEQAASDPHVLAIKQTLYRTSGESPVIKALVRAAQQGKQVTVLVELKARFDEAKNVGWARRLEDAGCLVIYGIAGYKTHAKLLLIVRRETHRVQRYLHLSTGNYNDRTAALYSDVGLMTSDADMTADAAAFFNLLTGYSQTVGWRSFSIAPTRLRERIAELIDREIQASTPDKPGLIIAKANALQDERICQALYRASQAGIKVLLNVRGICCLRPGVKGVSDNIEVVSIVDRYLEHARIFYFRNGGHEEVYLSSADWMARNLERRLEVLFPIRDRRLKRRLIRMLRTFLADNVNAWRLLPSGVYERVPRKGRRVRAQESFHLDAVESAKAKEHAPLTLQPVVQPKPPTR
jgi:polyphosphate kinase